MDSIVRGPYGETADSRVCIGSLWVLESGNAISVRVGQVDLTLEVSHMFVEGNSIGRHSGHWGDLLFEVAEAVFSTDQCRIVHIDSGLAGRGCDVADSDANSPLPRTIRC